MNALRPIAEAANHAAAVMKLKSRGRNNTAVEPRIHRRSSPLNPCIWVSSARRFYSKTATARHLRVGRHAPIDRLSDKRIKANFFGGVNALPSLGRQVLARIFGNDAVVAGSPRTLPVGGSDGLRFGRRKWLRSAVGKRARKIDRQIETETRHFPAPAKVDDVLAHPDLGFGGVPRRDRIGDAQMGLQHPLHRLRQ